MNTKQPSYQKHTRASLGRIAFKPQPVEKKTTSEKQIEWRKRVIKQRLDLMDRILHHLAPTEKWPTMSAVRLYRKRTKSMAQSVSPPVASRHSVGNTYSTKTSPSKFPIPIRTSKDISTFPQFSRLPVEIRLLIVSTWLFDPLSPSLSRRSYLVQG